jgi:NADH:ubiquinone oxidoreductase subunit H
MISIEIIRMTILIFLMILFIAFLTLFERKILSIIQLRRGPNIVGV